MSNSLEQWLYNVFGSAGMPIDGYYCKWCKRRLPVIAGVCTHDDVPHPEGETFEDDKNDRRSKTR